MVYPDKSTCSNGCTNWIGVKQFSDINEKIERWTCKAFPGGVPQKILMGEADHTKPFPGDHGIQFEAT